MALPYFENAKTQREQRRREGLFRLVPGDDLRALSVFAVSTLPRSVMSLRPRTAIRVAKPFTRALLQTVTTNSGR